MELTLSNADADANGGQEEAERGDGYQQERLDREALRVRVGSRPLHVAVQRDVGELLGDCPGVITVCEGGSRMAHVDFEA